MYSVAARHNSATNWMDDYDCLVTASNLILRDYKDNKLLEKALQADNQEVVKIILYDVGRYCSPERTKIIVQFGSPSLLIWFYERNKPCWFIDSVLIFDRIDLLHFSKQHDKKILDVIKAEASEGCFCYSIGDEHAHKVLKFLVDEKVELQESDILEGFINSNKSNTGGEKEAKEYFHAVFGGGKNFDALKVMGARFRSLDLFLFFLEKCPVDDRKAVLQARASQQSHVPILSWLLENSMVTISNCLESSDSYDFDHLGDDENIDALKFIFEHVREEKEFVAFKSLLSHVNIFRLLIRNVDAEKLSLIVGTNFCEFSEYQHSLQQYRENLYEFIPCKYLVQLIMLYI